MKKKTLLLLLISFILIISSIRLVNAIEYNWNEDALETFNMLYEPGKGFVEFIDANGLKTHPNFYAETQALATISLFEMYKLYGCEECKNLAVETLEILKNNFFDKEYGGFVYYISFSPYEKNFTAKYALTQVLTSLAFAEGYEITKNQEYQEISSDTINLVEENLYDAQNGRLYHTAHQNWVLTGCEYGCCGNGTWIEEQAFALLTFTRMYEITKNTHYKQLALSTLQAFPNLLAKESEIDICPGVRPSNQTWVYLISVKSILDSYELEKDQKYLELGKSILDSSLIRISDGDDPHSLSFAVLALGSYYKISKDEKYFSISKNFTGKLLELNSYPGFWHDYTRQVKFTKDQAIAFLALAQYDILTSKNYTTLLFFVLILALAVIILIFLIQKFLLKSRLKSTIFILFMIFILILYPKNVKACAGGWDHYFYNLKDNILFLQLLNENTNQIYSLDLLKQQNDTWLKFEKVANAYGAPIIGSYIFYPYRPIYKTTTNYSDPLVTAGCNSTVNGCYNSPNPNPVDVQYSYSYNTTFNPEGKEILVRVDDTNTCECYDAYCNGFNSTTTCNTTNFDKVYFKVSDYIAGYKAHLINNQTLEAGFVKIGNYTYKISVDNITNPSKINLTAMPIRLANLNFSGSLTSVCDRNRVDALINNLSTEYVTYDVRNWTFVERIYTDSNCNYFGDMYVNVTPGAYNLFVHGLKWGWNCDDPYDNCNPIDKKPRNQSFYVLHDPLQVYRHEGGNEVFNLSGGVNYTWLINITNYASSNWSMTLNLSILNTSNYLLKNETKPFFVLAGQNNITTFNFSTSTEWPSEVKAVVKLEGLTNSTWLEYFNVTDYDAPRFSGNSTNSTLAGTAVSHNLYWTDNVGLSYAIFSFDNCTGTLENDTTWVAFTANPDWSNVTKTINSTVGCTIRWKIYANDTSNNWNASEVFSYTTTTIITITLESDKMTSNRQIISRPNSDILLYGKAFYTNGTSYTNQQLNFTYDTRSLGSDTTNASGYYSFTFSIPYEGSYNLTVKARDASGNTGENSTTLFVSTHPIYAKFKLSYHLEASKTDDIYRIGTSGLTNETIDNLDKANVQYASNLTHGYVCSYDSNGLLSLIHSGKKPDLSFVNFSTNASLADYTLELKQKIEDTNLLLTYSKGTCQNIEDKMYLVESYAIPSRAFSSFSYPIPSAVPILIQFKNDRMQINGSDRFSAGDHKICAQKSGISSGSKPIIDVSVC